MTDLIDCDGRILMDIFTSKYIRKMQNEGCLWEIKGTLWNLGDYFTRQESLIKYLISHYTSLVLSYSEDPIDDEIQGEWKNIGPESWLIPSELDVNVVYNWLRLGNWGIYNAEKDLHIPDLFECKWSEIQNFLKQHDIQFILQSWHDCNPWRIAIHP